MTINTPGLEQVEFYPGEVPDDAYPPLMTPADAPDGYNPYLLASNNFETRRAARAAWWEQHLALIRGMEPAAWPMSRFGMSSLNLTDAEIIEIRERYAAGETTQRELADAFDCDKTTIQQIVTGASYRNVGGPITHRGCDTRPPKQASS